jgi:serine/threonine protein kinase
MGSLDVELTKREFSELEALQLFHGICLGLNAFHAHQPPLAHRDMKVHYDNIS